MNLDKDIDNIRRLLDRYYRAETTPEEERWLESVFSDAESGDIPDDMKADAKLFGLMSMAHPLPSDYDIPDNLEKKLSAIMEEQDAHPAPRRYTIISRILKYSGIAAAACIVWAIIPLLHSPKHSEIPEHQIADAGVIHDSILTIQKSAGDKYSFNETTGDRSNLTEAAPERQHQTTKTKASTGTGDSDGYIEITDPEEAKEIAIEIGKLLAFNTDKTNEAITQISNSIDSYKEITKTILQ